MANKVARKVAKKVLVALELNPEIASEVLVKARAMCEPDDELSVITVVDPTTLAYTVDPTMTGKMMRSSYDQAMLSARDQLVELCEPYNITPEQCDVRYGRIAHEVHQALEEGQFDVLVLGSHGRSGWRRLLGSVASSILHGVPVDTWVVKIGKMADDANG